MLKIILKIRLGKILYLVLFLYKHEYIEKKCQCAFSLHLDLKQVFYASKFVLHEKILFNKI